VTRGWQQQANTESVDDYLKAIFHLSDGGERRVSSGELADRLEVAQLRLPT
jgi:DtxR family Mn-dependent transcriptional regulator